MSLLSYALAAARRGWHVFPVVPGQKRAAVKAWEDRATIDEDRIRRCWATGDWNIGIACGPSNLLVVDLDMPKAGEPVSNVASGFDAFAELATTHGQPVPADTFCVGTASGGFHMYYRHPDGPQLRNTTKKLAPLVDTRSHGGYIVAPGSHLASGGTYTAHPADVADLPDWLGQLLRPAPPPPQAAPVNIPAGTTRAGRYLEKAIAGAVDAIRTAGAVGDGRKTALFNAALTLGRLVAGGALDPTETEQLLTTEASRVGVGPHIIRSTISSAFRYGADRPRSLTA